MRAYELKRGWAKQIGGGGLKAIAASAFGSATEGPDGKVVASFGACKRLTTWTDGKSLFVEMEMNPGVPDDVARQTISAYNGFLEQATGLDAKSRQRKARQSAKANLKDQA